MRLIALILATIMVLPAATAAAQAQDAATEAQKQEKGARVKELLAGWQQRLKLTDEQTAQTKGLLEKLAKELGPLSEKINSGEVDKRGALRQIQSSRKSFQTSFEAILTDEQKKEWTAIKDETRDHIAKVIGEKRAARMQETYKLSESQMQACVPVLTKQTTELMGELDEIQKAKAAGDPPARRRAERREKMEQAREMKGIADEADEDLQKIFTAEQWEQYQADKAKRKEEMKQKRKQSGR